MNAKIKNIIFHISGISLYLVIFTLIYYFVNLVFIKNPEFQGTEKIAIGFCVGAVVAILILGIFAILNNATFDDEYKYKYNITKYPFYYLFWKEDAKWIYHSELGYFLCIIKQESLVVYKQEYFYRSKIEEFYTHYNYSIDTVSNSIKEYLDRIYLSKLDKIKKEKEILDKNNRIKKWDGFLDVAGRRDGKINQLLK